MFNHVTEADLAYFRELLPEALKESMEMDEFDFIILEESDTDTDKRYDRICLNKDSLAAVLPATHPLADSLRRGGFFRSPFPSTDNTTPQENRHV